MKKRTGLAVICAVFMSSHAMMSASFFKPIVEAAAVYGIYRFSYGFLKEVNPKVTQEFDTAIVRPVKYWMKDAKYWMKDTSKKLKNVKSACVLKAQKFKADFGKPIADFMKNTSKKVENLGSLCARKIKKVTE